MTRLKIQAITFLAGACVMAVEVAGSRVLAPYVGTSIFVWSSLIGVILACLGLGAWLGGRAADRRAGLSGLVIVFLVAAASILIGSTFKDNVMYTLHGLVSSLQLRALIGASVLFAVPSLFLGMVTPYAIRLRIEGVESSGEVVGRLMALSTAGSIAGTFATGFVLIPSLGSARILMLITVVLASLSLLITPRDKKLLGLIAIVLVGLAGIGLIRPGGAFPVEARGVTDVETMYNRVWIYERTHSDGRPIRVMRLNDEINSAMYLDSDELVYDYLKFFHLAPNFGSHNEKTLLIGGGAFSYPSDFVSRYPEATIDVVELDPDLVRLSREYFGFSSNPRIHVFHQDGRVYLDRTQCTYDTILIDAFQSMSTIPFQLTTTEAVGRIRELLRDDGVVMVNMIGSILGQGGEFVRSEVDLYRRHFKHVYLYPLQAPMIGERNQNIILVATNSTRVPDGDGSDSWGEQALGKRWTNEIPPGRYSLRDDFAPVEFLGRS